MKPATRTVRVEGGMRQRAACVAVSLIICTSAALVAQVANENLANRVIDARRQDATLIRQYNWNCRTELVRDGKVEDIRIDSVTFGPEGQLQRTVLNDQSSGRMPRRFLRYMIAEDKKKEIEEFLTGLHKVLDQYTLPTAGKVIDFMSRAQIQPVTSADGKSLLQVTGNDVVVPGDSLTLLLDAATMQTRSAQVTTSYKGDQATLSATFNTLQSGLNYPQFAEITVPARNLSLQVHNYDFVRNQ